MNTTGIYNTAIGSAALLSNKTGSKNAAEGVGALNENETGNNNTALGTSANLTTGNLHNATAIGYNARVDASNKVRIGNKSVSSIGGQVGWTSFSDERVKKDVVENVPGLAFITALRLVTYHFSVDKEDELMDVKDEHRKILNRTSSAPIQGITEQNEKDLAANEIEDNDTEEGQI